MINIAKEQTGTSLLVRLAGAIEENVSLDQIIGPLDPPPSELVIICKEVTRINSDGVKAWIRYFLGVQAKAIPIRFRECSPAIVQQINFISNFTAGGEVESIMIPYACTQCKAELLGLFKTADILNQNMVIQDVKCSKCGGKAVFDDIPEEYFLFLTR